MSNREGWSAVEESGASNAPGRVAALARLDQNSAEVNTWVNRTVEACRADLAAGTDPMRVIATIATASADNGLQYASTMFAHAVLQLARRPGGAACQLQEAVTALEKAISVGWRGREEERTEANAALDRIEQALGDLATLVPIGRMYLDALDADPENEYLTLPEALGVTYVREAVERGEAT